MSLSIAASEGINELHHPVVGELSSVAARTVKIPEVTLTLLKTMDIYFFALDSLQLARIHEGKADFATIRKAKGNILVSIPKGEYNLHCLQQAIVYGHGKDVAAGTCELRITATGVYFFSKVQVILDIKLADLLGISEVPRVLIHVPVQWGPPSVSIYCDLVDPNKSYEGGKPSYLLTKVEPLKLQGPSVWHLRPFYIPLDPTKRNFFRVWTVPTTKVEVLLEFCI